MVAVIQRRAISNVALFRHVREVEGPYARDSTSTSRPTKACEVPEGAEVLSSSAGQGITTSLL